MAVDVLKNNRLEPLEGIADFAYTTLSACQRAIACVVGAEALGLLPAFQELVAQVPAPKCNEERRLLHNQLKSMALSGALHLHRAFHTNVRGSHCHVDLIEESLTTWSDGSSHDGDARTRLLVWTRQFQDRFERVHPWPPELVVEAKLRQVIGRQMTIDELLADVRLSGAYSRASIRRAFKRRFGTTVSNYQRALRIGEAARLLHETSWSNECIAKLLGYESVKNLYSLTRAATGLTPGELRRQRREDNEIGTRRL